MLTFFVELLYIATHFVDLERKKPESISVSVPVVEPLNFSMVIDE